MVPPLDPIASLRAALRGHYDIEREIGQGAFATVYLARDLKHERKVAIKVLHADPSSETGELRFVREIRLLARLQHPNILPLHDSGHVEALLYYVMPYVSGETLRDRINRERRLSPETACGIARDAADALAYAHAQGVIHRDIKPENILLSAGHPILADFGIAHVIDLAGVRQLTRPGTDSPGTPAYMSPEQLIGDHVLDGRSDTYSLGCVLYEMLTGKPPFAGKEGFVKRFTEPAPNVLTHRPDLAPWMDAAVQRALARDPADRYQTAGEFVRALRPPGGSGAFRSKASEGSHGETSAATGGPQQLALGTVSEPGKYHATPPGIEHPEISDRAEVDEVPQQQRVSTTAADALKSPRLKASVLLLGLAVAAAGALFVLARSENVPRVFGAAPLDSSRVVILPFRGDKTAASDFTHSLSDAWNDWQDLRVPSDVEMAEFLPSSGVPSSIGEAREIARKLRARRFVWGEVAKRGSATQTRLELYDAAETNALNPRTVVLQDPPATRDGFVKASIALLKNPQRPVWADGGDEGTHSFAAWSAYGEGHIALAKWDLAEAERQFRTAATIDDNYSAPHVWLAQLLAWTHPDSAEWSTQATRAMRHPETLDSRDRMIATAVAALSNGNYADACDTYIRLTKQDPQNFVGWFGMGECQRLDRLVIRNRASKSGWSFRSSFFSARRMYLRAMQLEPRAHALMSFERMEWMLPTSPNATRLGRGTGPDSMVFAAFPSLSADTLAFVPYPVAEFAALPASAMSTHNAALDRDSDLLLSFADEWTRQFPLSADAHEAHADILEARGDVADSRSGRQSALGAALRALELSTDPDQRLRLATQEVWLRLKRSEFAKARALTDSLLTNQRAGDAGGASELIGLAAMTGRIGQTAQLARLGGWSLRSARVLVAPQVAEAASTLFARAALGACGPELTASLNGLETRLRSYVPENQRSQTRSVLADRSFSLMAPCTNGMSSLRIQAPQDRLYKMQRSFARNDLRAVRATLDSLAVIRRAAKPNDLTLDYTFQEAWLKSAMGDTADAIAQLDVALGALPTLNGHALRDPAVAAALGRSMALRADLAAARHDTRSAKQWASALVALWSGADSELQPTVSRMRQLAASRSN
jgi:serine/threonine protein kinase/tetratricopeptide (TPR) repeat protein